MKKTTTFITMFVLLMLLGCQKTFSADKEKIYEFICQDTVLMQIVNFDDDGQDYNSIIKGEELDIIKNELRNFEITKKYSTNSSEYSSRFRSLFIIKSNDKQIRTVLYSTEEGLILVREHDIYPEKPFDFLNPVVFECHISKPIVNILLKHEKELPKEGRFMTDFIPN